MDWDVIVIGAGAAGLMSAARASERGRHTLLLEKNRKLGVKILMSGGTRCNITHATDARGIVSAFGKNGPFLHSALAALSPDQLVDLIERLGVPTKVESTGKVFPVSDRALHVRDALVRYAEESGAVIRPGEPAVDIRRLDAGFAVTTPSGEATCDRLIITTGGKSYPGCGTTGDGYSWAQQFGHSLVPPRPALAPILISAAWVHELSGLTLPDVAISLVRDGQDQKPLDRRRGSFLFTHFGISGPVGLDISGTITAQPANERLALRINFLPDQSKDMFAAILADAARTSGAKPVTRFLEEHVPKSLARALAEQASIEPHTPLAECSRDKRNRLCEQLFQCPLAADGTKGFEKAEVTAGGVSLDEVDSRSMESKLVPGLYFAGEILDLDGPIGGFNFQGAFSTGWLAGDRV